MTAPSRLKNILLRNKRVNASRAELKRLMLTSYLAVTCLVVAVLYTILDLVNNVYYALPAYLVLFLIPVLSLYLLRVKKYKAAN